MEDIFAGKSTAKRASGVIMCEAIAMLTAYYKSMGKYDGDVGCMTYDVRCTMYDVTTYGILKNI